jgi:hypothetical protein
MEPLPKLQRMSVREWVSVAGVSLRTDLDLWLKAELCGERELPREILEEARDPAQGLPVHCRRGKQK